MQSHCIKIRFSIEHRDRIYVKGYGFLFFAKNMGTHKVRNKFGQKLLNSAKKSTTDSIKTTSKRAIQKTAEATVDLIGSKIADKITSVSKKPAELRSTKNDDANSRTEVPKRKDTYLQKKRNKLLMN